jgi:proline iminopeptidase
MNTLFPLVEPYRTGTLKVSELHTLFYEEVGNPQGKPALFLHGGPGVGIKPGYRQFFDSGFYRIVMLDQRGAGKSTPHAELRENNTWALVEDLEKLKRHLGIDKWLVLGGSWGSTLALSYAITYPDSLVAIVIRGIFLARQRETDWLFKQGASEIYPDQWEQFVSIIPHEERDDIIAAYYRRLTSNDERVRIEAAKCFSNWEASTMCLIPDAKAVTDMTEIHSALSIARTECHYTLHRCFMPTDNHLLDNIDKIKHIPCRIVQGRYDVICPPRSAWELHKALPKSELRIVPDGGHSPFDSGMASELIQATEDFKQLFL